MKRAKPKPVVVRSGPQLLTGPPRTPMNPKHTAPAPPLDEGVKVRLPSTTNKTRNHPDKKETL